ncbi:hypothetical protein DSECCO2_539440 [anaerobic digester metagenome]
MIQDVIAIREIPVQIAEGFIRTGISAAVAVKSGDREAATFAGGLGEKVDHDLFGIVKVHLFVAQAGGQFHIKTTGHQAYFADELAVDDALGVFIVKVPYPDL